MPFDVKLQKYFDQLAISLSTNSGDWTVKGFIDIYKNIYTISVDTKVISKIVELMIFPIILKFSQDNNYELILSGHQNHYPDITFIDKKTGERIALDLKSTYRVSDAQINGLTLGAFTGYFRNRYSNKNITYPYSEYSKHYILGVIYSKMQGDNLETSIYKLEQLEEIVSVVRKFDFFVQEKWKIATDRPGSGNTKNIGSTTSIDKLKNGLGVFTQYQNGQEIFDDYWMYYLTKDMARSVDLEKPPYHNLQTYFEYKQKC
jgi:hypothetical protein